MRNGPFAFGFHLTRASRAGTLAPGIALTSSSVSESAATSTVIGALSVANHPSGASGWTFAITSQTPTGKLAISGANLQTAAALDYETNPALSVTITASKTAQSDIVRTIPITVTNVLEVTLGTLALSSAAFTAGTPASGTITGASSGSTIVGSNLPSGFTIDGAARTWAWDGTGSASTGNLTLTETHADGSNNPKANVIAWTISAASSLATPALTWTSGTAAYDPTFSLTEIIESDVVELEIDDVNTFTSLFDSDTNTIDSTEAASGSLTFAGITSLTPGTTFYARARYQRGAVWSDWSNIVSKALDAAPSYPFTTLAAGTAGTELRGLPRWSTSGGATEAATFQRNGSGRFLTSGTFAGNTPSGLPVVETASVNHTITAPIHSQSGGTQSGLVVGLVDVNNYLMIVGNPNLGEIYIHSVEAGAFNYYLVGLAGQGFAAGDTISAQKHTGGTLLDVLHNGVVKVNDFAVPAAFQAGTKVSISSAYGSVAGVGDITVNNS